MMTGILKPQPLTELLTQSISPNVSWALLLTSSGALLASGTPAHSQDAKKARTHAALAANIWSAYARVAHHGTIEASFPDTSSRQVAVAHSVSPGVTIPEPVNDEAGLKSLTLELSDYNLHIQEVAAHVLLCLIGPKAPTAHASSNSSVRSLDGAEGNGNGNVLRGSPMGSVPKSSGSAGSAAHTVATRTLAGESAKGTMGAVVGGGGSLGILKTQAQALVTYLEKELIGFEPREEA